MKKWKTVVIITLLVLIVLNCTLIFRIKFSHNWKPKSYERIELEQPTDIAKNVRKSDLKRLVDKLVNIPHLYTEKGKRMQNWG